jgi:ribosome-associated protein
VARDVEIRGDMIRLGQLLKLSGVVDVGGEIKDLLASESVLVNGEPEDRRGRQLHPGDVVAVAGEKLVVVAAR